MLADVLLKCIFATSYNYFKMDGDCLLSSVGIVCLPPTSLSLCFLLLFDLFKQMQKHQASDKAQWGISCSERNVKCVMSTLLIVNLSAFIHFIMLGMFVLSIQNNWYYFISVMQEWWSSTSETEQKLTQAWVVHLQNSRNTSSMEMNLQQCRLDFRLWDWQPWFGICHTCMTSYKIC